LVKSVVLDAGILGLLTNPKRSDAGEACAKWLQSMIINTCPILVPEITDYEIRRELLRANKLNGLLRLDSFIESNAVTYLPIDTAVMRQAALLWAEARQQGRPASDNKALDADMILAAQAIVQCPDNVVIATTNVKHFPPIVRADTWQNAKHLTRMKIWLRQRPINRYARAEDDVRTQYELGISR
jgi:predicted nucleic acid-binding protein